jgi:signal transduction histidine kinase
MHDALTVIINRLADSFEMISKGLLELKSTMRYGEDSSLAHLPELQPMMDTFVMARVRLRFLIGHYISVCRSGGMLGINTPEGMNQELFSHAPSDFVGLICVRCDVRRVVELAIEHVQLENETIPIRMVVPTSSSNTIVCVPMNIYTIVVELLRNAMRSLTAQSPPIVVRISDNPFALPGISEDVCVSVEDKGKGFNRKVNVFNYLYTTKHPARQHPRTLVKALVYHWPETLRTILVVICSSGVWRD